MEGLLYLSTYGKDGDLAVCQIEVVLENWSWHHGWDDHECCDAMAVSLRTFRMESLIRKPRSMGCHLRA